MQQQAAKMNEEKQAAASVAAGNRAERGEASTSEDPSREAGRYLLVPSTNASR